MVARGFPPHAAQYRFVDVLQRNIYVARDFAAFRDRLDQFIAPMRWVCIKQSHPEFALDFLDFAKQGTKRRPTRRINWLTGARFLRPQVHPIIGCVLTDQVYLTHAFLDESSDLCEHGFRSPTAVFSPHLWDHAKTTRMIAAFGNFDISRVRWRKPKTRCVVIGDITGKRRDEVVAAGSWGTVRPNRRTGVVASCYDALNNFSKFTHLIESYERVHFWQQFAQLTGESLRHTAAHD